MTNDDGPPDSPAPDATGSSASGSEVANNDPDSDPTHRDQRDEPTATGDQSARETPDDTGTDQQPNREALLTERRTVDERIRWKWTLRVAIVAALIGAIAGAIGVVVLEWGVLPGVGAVGAVAVLGLGYVVLLYRSWRYEIRTDALYLERGVFTHVKTVVPFVRVQHIDTSRDPIDRAIGLSSLVVYTAGSRGADVTVPGLTPEQATDLQDRLKVLAKESTGDDAV